MIDLSTRVRPSEEILFREIDGEAVVLHLADGHYFGLDETGTRMWSALVAEGSLAAARGRLLGEYEVGEEELTRDLIEFTGQLVESRVLIVEAADAR